ncbi:MAG: GTPase HflX [Phycisphaerales bacterium]|nr:GTPase HflX [Phycisphaerales bacterium]
MAKNTWINQAGRDDLAVSEERAVLVGVLLDDEKLSDTTLVELTELARSAGAVVVDKTVQRRKTYNAASCVGKGKLEEIRQRADAADANLIIFDNDLSPSQIREIEAVTHRKVLDRSELILDIFASRARTAEARLQVELAQLEYTAPRLRGMWTHLERIAGAGGAGGAGSVGGIGTRGPGERQIEIDRRIVGRRIAFLKDKLAEIHRRRVREVAARRDYFKVSLVGYTNAGKSTLMNALTGAGARAEDRLFATLDTLTRRVELGAGRAALLSDTVGFIRNLPHHLVASFRATLEEAIHADLLLHVVDASSTEAAEQIAAVNEVLHDLEVPDTPMVIVLNKVDAVRDETLLTILRHEHPKALEVSALTGQGVDQVRNLIDERMRGERTSVTLSIAQRNGKALNFVDRFADVDEREYDEDRVIVHARMSPRALEELHKIAADVRHVDVNGHDE